MKTLKYAYLTNNIHLVLKKPKIPFSDIKKTSSHQITEFAKSKKIAML